MKAIARAAVPSLFVLALVHVAGCGGGGEEGAPRDAGQTDAPIVAIDDAAMRRADSGTTSPRDGGASTERDGGTIAPSPRAVHFVALGDQGEGNAAQRAVGDAIRSWCATHPCDFAILLGDNIYDSGVDSVDDPQWRTKFEEPYHDIDMPFYAVLGNHDYGGTLFFVEFGGLGNEFHKGPIEVMYTLRSERWEMPATHYTLLFENVGLVMLDTNSILWDDTTNGDQWAWYRGAIADLRADGAEWIIAAGHHPYRSNGAHGNAGTYESLEIGGRSIPLPVPIMDGRNVRRFFDDLVCGTVDIYLCGHDHNRQWLDEPDALCGAELIVSGAGSKTTDFQGITNDVLFADDTEEGFLYVVIEGDRMTGTFLDRNGSIDFEHTVTRRRRP